jgi:hypothetical protein
VTAGPWRMFLSSCRVVRTRFGRLLASTPRRANCPHGSTPSSTLDYGCSFRPLATPEQLPSPRRRRWGRPPRRRVTEPFRHAYRSGLPGGPRGTPRRRGTLTGQCGQPLCPGEITSHLDGPQRPTVACAAEGDRRVPPMLRQAWERGMPSRPKRDPSRTILAWPLRRRPLPDDAGCVPLPKESSSKDFRTGTAPHG